MAKYSITTHSLQFDHDYTVLNVVRDGQNIDTFRLDSEVRSVSVLVDNDCFNLDYAAQITEQDLPHKYDIDATTTVSFNQGRMGGVGIIDLRDMGRLGNFTVEYVLTCGIHLACVEGPFSLWVKPLSPKCFSIDEN